MTEERKEAIRCIQQAGWAVSYMTEEHVFISDGHARKKLKWEEVSSAVQQMEGGLVDVNSWFFM